MPVRLVRLLSLVAALALVAAACGSGDTETGAAPAADSGTDSTGDADSTDDVADSGETDDDGDAAEQADDAAPDDATRSDDGSVDADAIDWPHTFVADQVGGGQIDANDLAGQDTILWFWAPW